ncbi:MAG: glycosyltransferase [Thermoanaerobaculia bacterium]
MLRALLLFCLASGGAVILVVAFNLALYPRLSRAAALPPPSRWPSVSVVIPARDEERAVEQAVRSQLAQDYPDFEVVVVDDRSRDGTPRILRELARSHGRLRVLTGKEPPHGWLGKPHALHQGSEAARGDLILFADADIVYHPQTLREAVTLMESRRLDLAALLPAFEMRGFWENVLMPYVPLAYFFGPAILANSDRLRWLAAGAGSGNLVRRAAYDAAGGHAALRTSVVDDVRLSVNVKRAGFRCWGVRAEDRLSVRIYRGFSEIWEGFTKNLAFVFQGPFGLLFLTLTLLTAIPALLPAFVLIAAILGAQVESGNVVLAAAGFALAVAARLPVALALRHPLWTALTNPLMVSVWLGITVRSLHRRLVRREVLWRGRRYDARGASF